MAGTGPGGGGGFASVAKRGDGFPRGRRGDAAALAKRRREWGRSDHVLARLPKSRAHAREGADGGARAISAACSLAHAITRPLRDVSNASPGSRPANPARGTVDVLASVTQKVPEGDVSPFRNSPERVKSSAVTFPVTRPPTRSAARSEDHVAHDAIRDAVGAHDTAHAPSTRRTRARRSRRSLSRLAIVVGVARGGREGCATAAARGAREGKAQAHVSGISRLEPARARGTFSRTRRRRSRDRPIT